MADNVTVDNGALTDFIASTDEAASGHVQRVKLTYSADGSDTHIGADASGLLVNLGSNNDVTLTSGTLTAISGTVTTSIAGTPTVAISGGTTTFSGALDYGTSFIGYVGIASSGTAVADTLELTNGTATAVGLVDSDGDQVSLASPIETSSTPSIDAGAYSDADNLDGDILSFANAAATSAGSGWISKLVVLDKDNETTTDYTVYLLNASITPPAQNAAFSLSDTDAEKIVGVIDTSVSGTWTGYGGGQVCVAPLGPPIPFKLASGTTLYAVVKVSGTPTYGSTSDLQFKLHILRD